MSKKTKKSKFVSTTIFRNNYLITSINAHGYYGCTINRKGSKEKHTLLWLTTDKISQMSNEEFADMLNRHGVA